MKINIWPTKKLGEVLDYEQPGKYIVNTKSYRDDYKTPVLTAGKTFILGHTNEKDNVFPIDELPVIIFDDFTTAIKFVDFPFKVKSSAMKILHAKRGKADIKFLFYAMKTMRLNHHTHKRYWISEYSKKQITLPPLIEQKKIVGKIGKLFVKIDEAKKLREEAKKATNTLLQSTLNEIFNKGKSKGWEEKTLGEICQIARGGSPRPIKEYLTSSDDGINWIKISDATSSTKYIYKTKEKIKKEGLKKTRLVMPGDFILTNSMSFGHPYIMRTSGAIHDGWLLLRPIKEIYSEYLYYFLGSDHIYNEFRNLAGGAVVKNLNSELVKNVKVLIPSIAEQRKIVAKLDKLTEKVRKMQKLQAETAAEMKNLKQSILAKAFKGEL